MKLYNQTKNQLRWSLSKFTFVCDPYGDVDVPDELVEHCKDRGLPLSVTPVAPEVKASDAVKSASDSAKKDEIFNLNKQLNEAIAGEKIAKLALEDSALEISELKNKVSALELDLKNETMKSGKLVLDYSALNKLFEEQAKELEIVKQERDLAKKTVEAEKNAKAAVQDKPKAK